MSSNRIFNFSSTKIPPVEGQLTVSELISRLGKMPPDALVWHEGCDCMGAADGIQFDRDRKIVLITRIDD